jgi:hypothetical protein
MIDLDRFLLQAAEMKVEVTQTPRAKIQVA